MQKRDPRRRSERIGVVRTGTMDANGTTLPCLVRDISSHGARLKLPGHRVEPGMTCVLTLPDHGQIKAHIVWSDGNEAGVRFEQEIALSESVRLDVSDIGQVLAVIEQEPPRTK